MRYLFKPVRMAAALILMMQLPLFSYALDTYQDNQIPLKVVDSLYGELPSDLPVILKIEAGRFTSEIVNILKQRLLEDGYNLFEKEPDEYQVVKLSYYSTPQLTTQKKLFRTVETRHTAHNFNYQITTYPEGKIDAYSTTTLLSQPVKQKNGMRWYDPIFITAVVGGLVYLLYFGD